MTRSQTPLLLLAAFFVVALGFGAWWLSQTIDESDAIAVEVTDRPDDEPAPVAPDRTSVVEPAEATLDADSTETSVAWPVQVDLELVESAEVPQAEGVAALGTGATATLRGRVLRSGDEGVAGARIEIVAGPNKGREIVANAAGEFGASGLWPGIGIARIQGSGVPGALRQIRLRKDVETLLNVGFDHYSQVWLTVHDQAGEPLEGVQVNLDGQTILTDEYGDAYFSHMTPGLDLVVELSKEGHATYGGRLGVSLGYDVPKGKIQYSLSQACRLDVVVGSSPGGKGPALVVLLPENPLSQSSSSTTALGGHPLNATDYPWHRVSPKPVQPGGRATFTDLPQQAIKVLVFHEGAVMEQRALVANLKPAKPQTLTVSWKPAPKLVGHVTFDGQPVFAAKVVLEAPDRTAATLQYFAESQMFLESMPIPQLPVAYQEVETDQGGDFVLSTWPDLARARYLRITSRDGKAGAVRLVGGGEERVDVELEPLAAGGSTIEVEFPGRFQGLPVLLRVNGEPRPELILSATQNLVVEDVSAGLWTLAVRWNGQGLVDPPERFEVAGMARRSVTLPETAILGQDDETLRRARGLVD